MEPRFRLRVAPFLALLIFLLNQSLVAAEFTQAYCSTQNTNNTNPFFWTWQSNGKCSDNCNSIGTFAFVVIQDQNCWCSNLVPAQQAGMSGCQVDCPGYPAEKCGDQSKGLYIYVKLGGQPSGTQGSSQPISKPTTLKTTTSGSMTSIYVVTESGAIVTRTLLVSPSEAPARTGSASSGSKMGAIAGGVVGGLLALGAIIGGILFLLWRRRKQKQEQQEDQASGSSGITRNASTMSKAGLIGGASEKAMQGPPQIVTTFAPHVTRHDLDSISPVRPSDHRYSQPVMIDSRLDPRAVLTFHGSNISRESLASMDDSRDYGRQLNVRNPDIPNRP